MERERWEWWEGHHSLGSGFPFHFAQTTADEAVYSMSKYCLYASTELKSWLQKVIQHYVFTGQRGV